ncbi:MAG TPA: FAD-dependent oxidoreductase [Candidatus Brocadiia bacterium]|nr:FAD-dependent oxidoreductase [Candidatus Brocadiia bacterium]
MRHLLAGGIGALLFPFCMTAAEGGRFVTESARNVPVAYDVDVVVVGGSTGAVAAAVEAAKGGAKVFLAAPRHYLGEDVCGTYRLWLEPGETPESAFEQELFREPAPAPEVGPGLPFTYSADVASAAAHRDSDPPAKLADGRWASAVNESVQYDGDATITADLGKTATLARVNVLIFQRPGDIETGEVAVSTSADGKEWSPPIALKNPDLSFEAIDFAIALSADVAAEARYVRFQAKKTDRVKRQLLGEIVIQSRELAEKSVSNAADIGARVPPTQMQVKRTLDKALLDAGVSFLYGCYATDTLRDGSGNLAGIVMANRSGRQAVRAKVVIDATDRAVVARMCGAEFRPASLAARKVTRVVVGGEMRTGDGFSAREMPSPVNIGRGGRAAANARAFEYTFSMTGKDDTFAALAEAEQKARDATWHPGQVAASEFLFEVPQDCIKSVKSLDVDWPGAGKANLDMFRPGGTERFFVLGACADASRPSAAMLLRPLEFIRLGARIGRAAALIAASLPAPSGVSVAGKAAKADAAGDIRENLSGLRESAPAKESVQSPARAIPVIGEYDVVIVGGGTGGAPAAISAARSGAKTLVIENLYGLGGVGTIGLIGNYYYGYRGGFTAEIDKGVAAMGGGDGKVASDWNIEWKMEWFRREIRKAGGDIWFGAIGCGAFVEGNRARGVVVVTPYGRGVVLAKTVIDATGNSDFAAAAGAQCIYTDASDVAVQGTGMPPWTPGAHYTNTDYTITDETDMLDRWRTFLIGRAKFESAYDLSQIIDTRERRRIVGDFVISPLDVFLGRTFPDTVVMSKSNFDTHGFTVHPLFTLRPPDKNSVTAFTPYRCLLPKGIEGVLVIGLGISAHRDAMPILRMQPDIQNQGYAAGLAAAASAREGKGLREIDIKALQKRLVEKGCLPQGVLTDGDSLPMKADEIKAAVANILDGYKSAAIVLAHPDEALPMLREAYSKAGDDAARLAYAHVLGMMGDATGADALLAHVAGSEWDKGWSFTGGGQFGASVSPLDSYIMALGYTRDPRAVPVIVEKVGKLTPESEFSHHRAGAIALETLGDPRAAQSLAELLGKPGMTGYASGDIAKELSSIPANPNEARDRALRELTLARALYRCGDWEGVGERILKEYARDLSGLHSRHAAAVLAEKKQR